MLDCLEMSDNDQFIENHENPGSDSAAVENQAPNNSQRLSMAERAPNLTSTLKKLQESTRHDSIQSNCRFLAPAEVEWENFQNDIIKSLEKHVATKEGQIPTKTKKHLKDCAALWKKISNKLPTGANSDNVFGRNAMKKVEWQSSICTLATDFYQEFCSRVSSSGVVIDLSERTREINLQHCAIKRDENSEKRLHHVVGWHPHSIKKLSTSKKKNSPVQKALCKLHDNIVTSKDRAVTDKNIPSCLTLRTELHDGLTCVSLQCHSFISKIEHICKTSLNPKHMLLEGPLLLSRINQCLPEVFLADFGNLFGIAQHDMHAEVLKRRFSNHPHIPWAG